MHIIDQIMRERGLRHDPALQPGPNVWISDWGDVVYSASFPGAHFRPWTPEGFDAHSPALYDPSSSDWEAHAAAQ